MRRSTNYLSIIQEKIQRYVRLISVVIVLGLFISLIGNVVSIRRAQYKITEAELRVEKLKNEHEELSAQLESVENDEYIEAQLRDKLGMAKEGEVVLIMPSDDIVRRLAPSQEEYEPVLPDPNWKKWLNLFM